MTNDKKGLIATCKCGCGESFSIEIEDTGKEDDYYAFLVFMKNDYQTEYYQNPLRALRIKLKKIWCIIRGKDYYYSDTIMTRKDFEVFRKYVNSFGCDCYKRKEIDNNMFK